MEVHVLVVGQSIRQIFNNQGIQREEEEEKGNKVTTNC